MNQLFQKLEEKKNAIKLKKIITGEEEIVNEFDEMVDLRNDIVTLLTDFMKTKNERKKALG